MTVYVTPLEVAPGGREWCRMIGTNLDELDGVASLVGAPAKSRVDSAGAQPTYYPLTKTMRNKALRYGAKERRIRSST